MKFQQSMLKGLWDTWKISFMTFCKLGYIRHQYDYKLEFPNIIFLKSSILDFQPKSLKQLKGYIEKSIYGLMQTRLYCWSVWLWIGIPLWLLLKVFCICFLQTWWNWSWDIWKGTFVTLREPGFITVHCGWNSELLLVEVLHIMLHEYLQNGLYGNVCLWPYVNWTYELIYLFLNFISKYLALCYDFQVLIIIIISSTVNK